MKSKEVENPLEIAGFLFAQLTIEVLHPSGNDNLTL
jgi:hypothetical protein